MIFFSGSLMLAKPVPPSAGQAAGFAAKVILT
jgi:hypothetical protein